MGIIINNAIVLIDQIDIEKRSVELREAIITEAGGAMFEPMATLIIGGLLLSSIMSSFFVPSVYYLLFRYGTG